MTTASSAAVMRLWKRDLMVINTPFKQYRLGSGAEELRAAYRMMESY